MTRLLRGTSDMVLATSQFVATLLFGAVIAPFGWVTPTLRDLGLFALAGAISVGALLCVNRSLKLAPASVVVPVSIHDDRLGGGRSATSCSATCRSRACIVGAAIIVAAGLYIFMRERNRASRVAAEHAAGVGVAHRNDC